MPSLLLTCVCVGTCLDPGHLAQAHGPCTQLPPQWGSQETPGPHHRLRASHSPPCAGRAQRQAQWLCPSGAAITRWGSYLLKASSVSPDVRGAELSPLL